MATYKNSA